MPQSYISAFYHLVFGTKDSEPRLQNEISERLYPYIGGIISNEIGTPILINGTEDHVHILYEGKATVTMSKAAQLIKANSSKWLNETFKCPNPFSWQEGYGGFTVSLRGVPPLKEYIRNQREHHRVKTFAEEYAEFIRTYDAFR